MERCRNVIITYRIILVMHRNRTGIQSQCRLSGKVAAYFTFYRRPVEISPGNIQYMRSELTCWKMDRERPGVQIRPPTFFPANALECFEIETEEKLAWSFLSSEYSGDYITLWEWRLHYITSRYWIHDVWKTNPVRIDCHVNVLFGMVYWSVFY